MIFDTLKNADLYSAVHPAFKPCFDYLSSDTLLTLTPGQYDIGTTGAHSLINRYPTKPVAEGTIERHRRFIDIQILLSGEEKIGVVPAGLCNAREYIAGRDFQQLLGPLDFITLKPGLFAIFFPEDGHMPGISPDGKCSPVVKIVIKVPSLL